jgi:hypothetical protein
MDYVITALTDCPIRSQAERSGRSPMARSTGARRAWNTTSSRRRRADDVHRDGTDVHGRTRRKPEDQWRAALGLADGDGQDRPRHRGRQQPPDPDRRGQRGAHLFKRWCDRGRHDHGRRRDGQHVRPPRRGGPRGACRSMWAATSTPSRRAGNTTGFSASWAGWRSSARSTTWDQDEASHRGHQLDQRGGDALRARHARLGRLCRQALARLGL